MNKTAIKNYAIGARNTLIEAVKQRAFQFGITEKDCGDPMADSVNGFVLTTAEKKQRQALIAKIREKGYEQVMEEAAYTWFNRFIALRFMEVNGYLPIRVRVFTDEENAFKPQILSEATHLELDGLKLDRVIALKEANKTEELFKYLLITQCNALSAVLPGMFQKIEDYTELLLPDNLLREGSVIEQLVATIPEEDWTDQVQIIGWLYQYYNTEPKDKVFADLKKNIKISKEKIPAATQLFTPDWIVRYMVENSLGRLWVEGHPNDELKANWRYYLEEAEQEPEVQVQLAEIRKGYASLNPEDLRVIDPCCGSGHILCYLFDVLMQIYEASGYTARDAAQSILIHNLWGLDIDERAAQLSYFAVMMKARQYDRRFFSRNIQPHVYAIAESNSVSREAVEYFCKDDSALTKAMQTILTELHDAKEYGSILTCSKQDWEALYSRFGKIYDDISLYRDEALALLPLIHTAEALSQQYDVVVTNPPYMGTKGMNSKISSFLKEKYSEAKGDMFAAFIARLETFAVMHGFFALVTQRTWLFIAAFEKLRSILLKSATGISFVELGAGAFEDLAGEVVQSVLFCMKKGKIHKYSSIFCDLTLEDNKECAFVSGQRARTTLDSFELLPGYTFAMKLSDAAMSAFKEGKTVGTIAQPKKGLISSDNNRFLRLWYEVNINRVQFHLDDMRNQDPTRRWLPHNKGGSFRRWYGNHDYLINWEENGRDVKEYAGRLYGSYSRQIMNEKYYLRESISWSSISSQKIGVRYYPRGFTFDTAGPSMFISDKLTRNYVFGLLGSSVAEHYIRATNPTINLLASDISNLPILGEEDQRKMNVVSEIVESNVNLGRADWDSFETSWDFQRHPLLPFFADDPRESTRVEMWYRMWEDQCQRRFDKLKANEEELNRIFIDIYGLQDELTPEVEDKDVTVRKADLTRDIKSLISYAVGCMFGRYSLQKDGIVFAGGEISDCYRTGHSPFVTKDGMLFRTADEKVLAARDRDYTEIEIDGEWYDCGYPVDADNILPICDDEYFEDDIVGRFIRFIEVVYGKDTLEENLKFIADALGGKGTPRDVIRSYFLNDFYADHLKIYQKRPIYWLFDSGKKNGFKCLIYMHRYQPDTIARIRTDYVHEQQSRYRTAIADLEQRVEIAAPAERVKLSKQLQKLRDQAAEVQKYEEKIHHLADQMIKIDLDDGVKVNYAKFEDVLAKIK